MIEVTGPDGAVHEFPDETSPDVIKRAMAKHYGSPAARQEASPHDPYAAFSSPVQQTDPYAAFSSPVPTRDFANHAASANPFNRQLGADVSYGQPMGPAPSADLSGEFRAAAGGPLMDRGAAALQTYLPQSLGGTGQNYTANLAANRAATAETQWQHPEDPFAGNLAGALPLLAVPGVGGAGVLAGLRGGAIADGLQGAASSPDWTDVPSCWCATVATAAV